MPGPEFTGDTIPDAVNIYTDDLDAMRDSFVWLMAAAAISYRLPGWATVVSGADKSKPDYVEMTKGTLKIKFVYSYTGDDPTGETWQYDDGLGGGYVTLTGGTMTISYDGSGNFDGVTVV